MKIPNEWVEYDDYYDIIIDSPTYGIFHISIDKDDYNKIHQYNWCISKYTRKYENTEPKFYAMNNTVGLMHRFIMNAPRKMVVDHKDRNTYNNQKDNLKICNQSVNARNHDLFSVNKSGVIGVRLETYPSGTQKWAAYICINGHHKSLGRYDFKDDAIKARTNAENELNLEVS